MDAITLLRQQAAAGHDYLETVMADVTDELAHWHPPGLANPVGATYAHLVSSEDMVVQGMLQGRPPLAATTSAGSTGLSQPHPIPGPDWGTVYPAWTREVRIDLAELRRFAGTVYEKTDAYLAGLTPEALDGEIDLSAAGLGRQTLAFAINRLVLGHIDTECGEIAALKGAQGVRGYPY